MSHPSPGDFSPESLAALIDSHLSQAVGYLIESFPGAVVCNDPDFWSGRTGIPSPLANVVCNARFDSSTADDRIEAALEPFRTRSLAAHWIVGPISTPANLGERLRLKGLIPAAEMPGMTVDLAAVTLAPAPPGARLERVSDEESLEKWTQALALGSGLAPEATDCCAQSCRTAGFDRDSPVQAYVASWEGKPASCAMLYLAQGAAGIYCVSTVPEARRRGLGACVTAAALHRARDLGYRTGLLQASAMGFPIYRGMGFETQCVIHQYLLPGPRSAG